jgi:hypothetical protein
MPKQINFHLTEAQRAELTKATKHDKRPEVRQRAAGICLLGRGDTPAVVAETLNVAQVTVYAWWHRYQVHGIDGLANQAKGRPETRADEAYLQVLAQTLDSEPSDLGYANDKLCLAQSRVSGLQVAKSLCAEGAEQQ